MEKFMKIHGELVELRSKIRDCESQLALLRKKEQELEGSSNYEFRNLADNNASTGMSRR